MRDHKLAHELERKRADDRKQPTRTKPLVEQFVKVVKLDAAEQEEQKCDDWDDAERNRPAPVLVKDVVAVQGATGGEHRLLNVPFPRVCEVTGYRRDWAYRCLALECTFAIYRSPAFITWWTSLERSGCAWTSLYTTQIRTSTAGHHGLHGGTREGSS